VASKMVQNSPIRSTLIFEHEGDQQLFGLSNICKGLNLVLTQRCSKPQKIPSNWEKQWLGSWPQNCKDMGLNLLKVCYRKLLLRQMIQQFIIILSANLTCDY